MLLTMIQTISEEHSQSIGRRIQYFRTQQGLRQEQLAKMVGPTPNFLSAIERGVKYPSLDSLIKITAVLKVPADAVLRTDLPCDKIMQTYETAEKILKLPESLQTCIFELFDALMHAADRKNL